MNQNALINLPIQMNAGMAGHRRALGGTTSERRNDQQRGTEAPDPAELHAASPYLMPAEIAAACELRQSSENSRRRLELGLTLKRLGAIMGIVKQILNFFFGSSGSSAETIRLFAVRTTSLNELEHMLRDRCSASRR
ncbi:MAG: hypothetical protein AB1412_06015 [Pseudomonadota bacterium]